MPNLIKIPLAQRVTEVTPFLAMAREILEATGVALTPGIDFGQGAEGFLRFSYANSMGNLDKAVDRIADFFRQHGWL